MKIITIILHQFIFVLTQYGRVEIFLYHFLTQYGWGNLFLHNMEEWKYFRLLISFLENFIFYDLLNFYIYKKKLHLCAKCVQIFFIFFLVSFSFFFKGNTNAINSFFRINSHFCVFLVYRSLGEEEGNEGNMP